jgi:putative ABC transport system permease protein
MDFVPVWNGHTGETDRLMKHLRHILRRLFRTPGFTFVAVGTLAIGIGANTAIFIIVNNVAIQPLSYPDADELVSISHTAPGLSGLGNRLGPSPSMYFTYRDENETFEHVGLWANRGSAVTGVGNPEQLRSLLVTHGTLDALNVPPLLGRWFSRDDDSPGSEQTVIVGYGFWQRKFGADAGVIGRQLEVDATPRTVIGVMPQGFALLDGPELMLPTRFDRAAEFLGPFNYDGIARLRDGVTLEAANADVARMLPIWMDAWPAPPGVDQALLENARIGPALHPYKEDVVGNIGQVLWVLMGTIGLVLVIACANVANLLLVRAESRQHELGIRAALGAGWFRIARELLLESVVLGLTGGAAGLGLAWIGLKIFRAVGPTTLPRLSEIGADGWALAFTLVVSMVSGLLFGLIPAVRHAGPGVAQVLRGGGRTMSQSRERHRARNTLVVVQVGLALVLLVGSGLMIRTFQTLRSVDPGFSDPDTIQLLRVSITRGQVEDQEQVQRVQQEIQDRLRAIPGVTAVAQTSNAPMEVFKSADILYVENGDYATDEIPPIRQFRFTGPEYFRTAGIPLLVGRDFTWDDLYEMRDVVVVSRSMAVEQWGSPTAAIGKRIRGAVGEDIPWREVVGVVGDVYDDGIDRPVPTIVYWPSMLRNFAFQPVRVSRDTTLIVRTGRAATQSFLDETHAAVWAVRPDLPVYRVRTLGEVYAASMARTSFTLVMLAIAGSMALILGFVGIYGVIAYTVTERTREIGVRKALGAQSGTLHWMFVKYGLVLGSIGTVIGIVGAIGTTRLLTSLLYEVSPLDPLTYVLVGAIVIVAAVLASYLPARRAATIDPMQTLRAE